MRRSFWLVLLALSACRTTSPVPTSGTVIIMNARVHGHRGADSILIEDGRIQTIGVGLTRAGATAIDADDGIVLPGFVDAHIHLRSGGLSMVRVQLTDAMKMDEVLQTIAAYAAAHPKRPWILGRGWAYDIVPRGTYPTRQQLDAVVSDRPVFLRSYDGHAGWANTKALELVGIEASTPDPSGGTIVRETGTTVPAGAFLENAAGLMRKAVPEPTTAEKRSALLAAVNHLVALGVTTVEDIETDVEVVAILQQLDAEGRLPIDVEVVLPLDGDLVAFQLLRTNTPKGRVRITGLKAFVDGVVESKTAYLVEPYADTTERGHPLLTAEQLEARVLAAQAAGFTVLLHCIGDAAVRMALDVYETAAAAPSPRAHRIEHIEVLHDDDVARFKTIGVVASMQPFHANPFGDTPDAGVWSTNLGADRLPRTFAWRTLLDAGATLRFGSDWPVMRANPLHGIAVAMTRQDDKGRPAAGWNRHQAITWDEAVGAYTHGLKEGGVADLVILAPDVDPTDPRTLWKPGAIRTVMTAGVTH